MGGKYHVAQYTDTAGSHWSVQRAGASKDSTTVVADVFGTYDTFDEAQKVCESLNKYGMWTESTYSEGDDIVFIKVDFDPTVPVNIPSVWEVPLQHTAGVHPNNCTRFIYGQGCNGCHHFYNCWGQTTITTGGTSSGS